MTKVYSIDGEWYHEERDEDDLYFGDRRDIKPSEILNESDVKSAVENMVEQANENLTQIVGEAGEDSLFINEERLTEMFTETLKRFIEETAENVEISCWAVDNVTALPSSEEE